MLDFKLTLMDDWQRRRDEIAAAYFSGLADVEDIILPVIRPGSTHTWHKFVIKTENRNDLAAGLRDRGVATMVHYPRILPDEPVMQRYGSSGPEGSTAREVSNQVLSLPIYPELTDREIEHVICSVRSACAGEVAHG